MDTPAPPATSWRQLARAIPRRTAAATAVLLVLNSVGNVAAAWQLGVLVTDPGWSAVAVLAIWYALREASWLAQRLVWIPAVERAGGAWRVALLERALTQPVHHLAETSAGELVDRVDDDTDKLVRALRRPAVMLAGSVMTAVLATALAATASIWALVGFLCTAVVAVAACVHLSGPAAEANRELEQAWTDVTVCIEEAVAARDDLRTTGGRAHALSRYSASVSALLRAQAVAATRMSRLQGTVSVAIVTVVLVTSAGAALAATRGWLEVAAAVSLAALASSFAMNVANATNNYPELLETSGALSRVLALLRAPAEPDAGTSTGRSPAAVSASVTFERAHFTYPHASSPSCELVSLHLEPGRSLGLVGRSGAGKSTMIALLTRQVDTPPGCVFLDGVDVCDIPLEDLRSQVQVVSQRTELVAGSVCDNVTLFGSVPRERVAAAFAELGLSDWVASLPDGIDTRIGPGGLELSSGEAQLVAFARLLVRDPLVVVLDEATARMDPLTEARVTRAASSLLHRRTAILVAHRLGTVRACDRIVVLDRGRVVQDGPRHLLAATAGPFADLVAASGLDPGWLASDDADDPPNAPAYRRTIEAPDDLVAAPLDERWRPRPWRTAWSLYRIDPARGLLSVVLFGLAGLLSFGGVVAATAWARTVADLESSSPPWASLAAFLLSSVVGLGCLVAARRRYPLWWTRVAGHLRATITAGQLADRRVRPRPAGEVVARALTSDRVVYLADVLGDLVLVVAVAVVPAAFLIDPATALVAVAVLVAPFGLSFALRRRTERLAAGLADARATSSVLLASLVDAARTVKLFRADVDAVARFASLDAARTRAAVRDARHAGVLDASAGVAVATGIVAVWALRSAGVMDATAALAASVTIGSIGYGAWLSQHVVYLSASARAWMVRAVPLAQSEDLVTLPDGVDFDDPPVPPVPPEPVRLEVLELSGVTVVHDDGLVAVDGCTFDVRRGEVVLVVGETGSGKSSLLAALAGLRAHTGEISWNGAPVADPEVFLRPGQVAYVAQQPRVLSGTFVDNVTLGHDLDSDGALDLAALGPDVSRAGGPQSVVGHRGVRLSGGQVQRLALARALAADTELVVADDVSSALDASTELEVWSSLRDRGCAVVAASCKLAAVQVADRVVVLQGGRQVACGPWSELADRYGKLVS